MTKATPLFEQTRGLFRWWFSDNSYGELSDPLSGKKVALSMTDAQFEDWQERVAIMVQDGGLPDVWAEWLAAVQIVNPGFEPEIKLT